MRFSLFLNSFSMKSGQRSGRKELKKKHYYLASPCLPAHGFLAFCNNNSVILGRKFWGWAAGGGFHEHQQEQRGLGRPWTGQRCWCVGLGTLLVCTNPAGCVCSSELLGEAESISAHFQAQVLDSLNLFWRKKYLKKKGKRKHINSSVFTGIA